MGCICSCQHMLEGASQAQSGPTQMMHMAGAEQGIDHADAATVEAWGRGGRRVLSHAEVVETAAILELLESSSTQTAPPDITGLRFVARTAALVEVSTVCSTQTMHVSRMIYIHSPPVYMYLH